MHRPTPRSRRPETAGFGDSGVAVADVTTQETITDAQMKSFLDNWGVPGSNSWPRDQIEAFLAERRDAPFDTTGAVPIVMLPGDALIHNILVLHGSAPAQSWYRRVLYYEFRSMETELRAGPHHPRYLPLKQQVLLGCLDERLSASYGHDEVPFEYRPAPEHAPAAMSSSAPDTYRYAHEDYWVSAS